MTVSLPIHGRGTAENPRNRFATLDVVIDDTTDAAEDLPSPRTSFLKDTSRSIIVFNDSPDVGFNASINPYRGCEHGCIYCYARPTHEYAGFSAGLDFETKILVKTDAPRLLRNELSSLDWKPQTLAISGVTDCYQPIERKLQLTRQCLEVLLEFRNPVSVITKSHLVTRDIDVLAALAKFDAAAVFVSVTTLDANLTQIMEPRTAAPARRLDAIRELSRAGIPVGVMVAPVIPGLTDHEIPQILAAARDAGAALTAGYVPVRLPFAVKDLFENWLERHMPDRKDKVLNRIRALRGGKLNDPNFHTRMHGQGVFADYIKNIFDIAYRKEGFTKGPKLSVQHFRQPGGLFD